ncbi:hypothetical protein GCM10023171_34020 [Microbacterium panaciterrae]|uniref:Uncharacterized protein n=1 Tax=Microbacterium panaciterrae TaxID=985759 RepID=A0ABP8PPB8_9MICO
MRSDAKRGCAGRCAPTCDGGWPEIRDPDLLTTMLARTGVPRIGSPDPAMLAALRLALR